MAAAMRSACSLARLGHRACTTIPAPAPRTTTTMPPRLQPPAAAPTAAAVRGIEGSRQRFSSDATEDNHPKTLLRRGEKAFCSEECRYRHILAEVDDDNDDSASVRVVAADCSSLLLHQAVAGCFTF